MSVLEQYLVMRHEISSYCNILYYFDRYYCL